MSASFDGGLPLVSPAAIPADVKTPAQRDAYRAALGFEQMLVEQLAQSMAQTAGGANGQDPVGGDYAALIPGALADAITQDGGLGLAPTIYKAIEGA